MSVPSEASSLTPKYHPILELGRGGMAEVFLAVSRGHGGFTKLLVLKQTRAEFSQDPDFVAMFLDEARLAARLNHPNVVQTYEVGQLGDHYFLAMEYLDGQPFNRARNLGGKGAPMPLNEQIFALCGVLSGLHHAHELCDYDGTPLGVVHRDVSPHNVFITYDGHVKVVDFGIAKAAGAAAQTQHGAIKGKLAYMPPEQATGKPVDRRADIFAVGVMLWEAVTEKRMWADTPESGILYRLGNHDIPALEEHASNVPQQLLQILQRSLSPDPAQRYSTAAEMESALAAYLAEQPQRVTSVDLGGFLREHFSEHRSRIKRAIEAQIRDFREDLRMSEIPKMPHSSGTPPSTPLASTQETPPSASFRTPVAGTFGPAPVAYHIAPTLQSLPSTSLQEVHPAPPSAPPSRKFFLLAVLGALTGGTLGGGLALRTLNSAPPGTVSSAMQFSAQALASPQAASALVPLLSVVTAEASAPTSPPSASSSAPPPREIPIRAPASKPAPAPTPTSDRAAFGGRK